MEVVSSCFLQYFEPCLYQCPVLYKKKSSDSVSTRNLMFQLANELREAHLLEKKSTDNFSSTTNNSHQSRTLDVSRKRKQCQINVSCEYNKTAKLSFECRGLVCGKCKSCVKVECVTVLKVDLIVHF